jgi:hypothetical protein
LTLNRHAITAMPSSVKATTRAPHGPEVEQILSNLMALFAVRRASCDRSFHNGQHRATSQLKKCAQTPTIRGMMGYSIRNLYVTISATMLAKISKAGSDFRSQVELRAADGAR